MRREYPADLWLTYRAIRYRPAQLQAFVARGGWGPGYVASDGRMVPELLRHPLIGLPGVGVNGLRFATDRNNQGKDE